jgi:gliding motility-associated-like protein
MRFPFLFFLCVIGWSANDLYGQGGLVASFTMDDCTLDDNVGMSDGFVFGPSPCTCGVSSNGLAFDGDVHFAEFSPGVSTVLQGDFTLTFYVYFLNTSDAPVDLLSVGNECSRDSVFYVKYFPSVRQLRVRISDSPGNDVELKAPIGNDICWHYIAIVKSGANMSLYVNNELVETAGAVSPISLNVNDNLAIANSPCLTISTNPDQRFEGRIDEMRLYDIPLTARAIQQADFQPDQIISSDTTIFLGESVQILTGGTCTSDFAWSPDDGLLGGDALNPIVMPEVSTTYTLTINQDNCTVEDDIRISVVTSEELTCNDLSFPSAFTPNNDGINDRYRISNDFLVETLISFEVFNKWGGRVFYSDDLSSSWDGRHKNEEAPPNAYVYRVNYVCGGEEYIKSGTVNLIR